MSFFKSALFYYLSDCIRIRIFFFIILFFLPNKLFALFLSEYFKNIYSQQCSSFNDNSAAISFVFISFSFFFNAFCRHLLNRFFFFYYLRTLLHRKFLRSLFYEFIYVYNLIYEYASYILSSNYLLLGRIFLLAVSCSLAYKN